MLCIKVQSADHHIFTCYQVAQVYKDGWLLESDWFLSFALA